MNVMAEQSPEMEEQLVVEARMREMPLDASVRECLAGFA